MAPLTAFRCFANQMSHSQAISHRSAHPTASHCSVATTLSWRRSWAPSRLSHRSNGVAVSYQQGAGTDKASISGNNKEWWPQQCFPAYLQSGDEMDDPEVFSTGVDAAASEARKQRDAHLWQVLRQEAEQEAAVEPLLSSFLYASILGHSTFEQALAFVLANRLSDATMLPAHLFRIFLQVLRSDDYAKDGALTDLQAHRERDPACHALCHALLFFKGYHAIQAHRIAHVLWRRDQIVLALALQSRMSEVLAVDIHPAACIGKGILLDHGTGVVIGETAVLGDNCSLLQNVNLGGTGTDTGDRHPKIGRNVLIDAGATVLGNITIGEGSQIGAGALVLTSVPPYSKVAGSPAKVVGRVQS